MNAQRGESLRGALAETYVAKAFLFRHGKDVLDGIWDIVPCEVIDAIVPKFGRVRVMMYRFLRVLVSAVVAQPYVKAHLDKDKRYAPLRRSQAYPHLGVHEEAMVQVHHWLACRRAHSPSVLSLLVTETVQTQ